MQTIKTLVVCKSYFTSAACRFIAKETGLLGPLVNYENISQLINSSDNSDIIILLEPKCLSEPKNFSLEKICSRYPSGELIALTDAPLDHSLQPFFKETIYFSDNELEIHEKVQRVKELFTPSEIENSSEISEREQEIVRLVAQGKTNKDISDFLNISTHTVITHRKNITAKLGIKSIAGLTVYAIINGLISPDEPNII